MARQSKYNSDIHDDIALKACRDFGCEDKKLAKLLSVSVRSIYYWKEKYPSFLQSIKMGKSEFDNTLVVSALLNRALGYSHPDIFITQYQGEIIEKEIIKHYPPDVAACIFWLCNRQPEKWQSVNKILLQKTSAPTMPDEEFSKLSIAEKIKILNDELLRES